MARAEQAVPTLTCLNGGGAVRSAACPVAARGSRVNGGHRPGHARAVAGQTELTSQQRRSLAGDGYLLVPSALAADAVDALAGRLDDLAGAAPVIAPASSPMSGRRVVIAVPLCPCRRAVMPRRRAARRS